MIRRPAFWLAVGLLLALLFVISSTPAKSTTSQAWRPVPTADFLAYPGSVAPAQSGRVEFSPATSATLPRSTPRLKSGPSATEAPTVVRTAVGGTIPDYVAERGVAGVSTWWNSWGHGFYAAAGPRLRDVLPNYVGKWVSACAGGRCVRVKLTTSCACPGDRLIDLSLDAFQRLAAPSVGIVEVVVTW